MDRFRRLAVTSTVATVVLVAIGGLVRATKSGLGCGTDWPHCGGRLIPSLETRAEVIEFSHRAAASVVVVLLFALAVLAFRTQRHSPRIVRASLIAFGLVMFQAVLGMIVVKLELEAPSVVLHLATALSLLAVLVYITVAAVTSEGERLSPPDRSVGKKAALSGAAILLLLLVGSYVTGREAGYVFDDWPLMNGAVIPDLGVELYAIHFAHRALAAVVGIVLLVALVPVARGKEGDPISTRLARGVLGLFAAEVMIGATNVWSELNSAVVTAHLLIGALIWAGLVGIVVVAHPAFRAVRERVVASPTTVLGSET